MTKLRTSGGYSIRLSDLTIYVVLIALVIINTVLQPNFIEPLNLYYVLGTAMPLIFASAAQGMVILISSIDLATGSVVSLVNVLVVTLIGRGSFVAICLAILAGIAMGLIAGLITTLLRLPAIIATLALSSVWAGLALYVLPTPKGGLPDWFQTVLAGSRPLWILVGMILLWQWFSRTKQGKHMYAIGANENAAYMSGVPILKTRLLVFAISGLLLALSALSLSATTGGGDPLSGTALTLQSIAAAVLGGIHFKGGSGSIVGAIAGAIVLALITNVVYYTGASAFYQGVVYGLLLILALSLSRLTGDRKATFRRSLKPRMSI
ncbi:MAG: transporter permease [Marmoricola sp.]|jgi:ribose transport system permease protein|nr:transporter permease [Marmoricola sp.]